MIKAEIIADSVHPVFHSGDPGRITTYILTYPRFIHSELMTHRQFSRNSSSSRAIPVQKMIAAVDENPAMPVWWGKNQPGMQAGEEVEDTAGAKQAWCEAAWSAVEHAKHLLAIGLHKQIANRVLEPFQWMTTLVTATEWTNFFALRLHPDAQPEFQELAYRMGEAHLASKPRLLEFGDWHIPFGDRMPEGLLITEKLKVATARCARLSYMTFEGEIDVEKDILLHDRLAASGHWSPFEHCATPCELLRGGSNFRRWKQYRKCFTSECVEQVNLPELVAKARLNRTALSI